MKRIPLVVLVGALAVAASACDVGPTAATVNGVAISQSALNADLSVLVGNESGQSSGAVCMLELQGSNPPTPAEGAGDGTVTQQLAAYQLSNMVLAQLIRERLASLGQSLTAADVAAARVDLMNQLTPSNSEQSSPCGSPAPSSWRRCRRASSTSRSSTSPSRRSWRLCSGAST